MKEGQSIATDREALNYLTDEATDSSPPALTGCPNTLCKVVNYPGGQHVHATSTGCVWKTKRPDGNSAYARSISTTYHSKHVNNK